MTWLPEMMRAAVIDHTGDPDVLHVAEVPRAVHVSAEVLVRVAAAGVNPIDAKTRDGGGVSSQLCAYPAILGNDFSGVVAESPYEAHPLAVGERVYGMLTVPRTPGSYAEYAPVPSLSLTRAPKNLSLTEAAGVPLAALTAWGAVVDVADVGRGQRVLVHAGAGGVGHFAVQFAALRGAEVYATASARNAEWLRGLGASGVIDYRTARFEDEVGDLDAVIDLIGNVHDETGTRSLRVLKPGGIVVNVPTGSWPSVAGDAAAAGMRGSHYKVSPDGARLAHITELIESGDVTVHIDRTFPLEEAAEAHRELEKGHTRGKIVLVVDDALA